MEIGQILDKEERKKGRPLSSEILNLLMPVDSFVLAEARKLSALKGVRSEDLATCIAQDPVLVIEFLKSANAICLSEGKPVLSSIMRAIDRLGSQSIGKLLKTLSKRQRFTSDEVNHWFEIHRSRCKRTSIVARILAETLAKHLADEVQLSGLFLNFGDLVTVSHLMEEYVSLAEEFQRGALAYRIYHAYKFEPQELGLLFLRKFGLPETLLAPLDQEGTLKPEKAIMKIVIASAGEMIDYFDANKWEKLSPGLTLPSKSTLRLLVITKMQYLKVYERATEYLNEVRKFELRQSNRVVEEEVEPIYDPQIEFTSQEDKLQNEIHNLLLGIMTEPEVQPESSTAPSIQELAEEFALTFDAELKAARSSEKPKKIAPPKLQTTRGNEFLGEISTMFETVVSSEELLTELLEKLTFDGNFEKAAVIALSNDRKMAVVVAARGVDAKQGQRMSIKDPLSPLAQGFSKVQSFGNVESQHSPFGSKAFALAPLNANHKNPVALYADCGNESSLTFESRRVFRTVVDMVNQKLVQLPGGIPIELDENY